MLKNKIVVVKLVLGSRGLWNKSTRSKKRFTSSSTCFNSVLITCAAGLLFVVSSCFYPLVCSKSLSSHRGDASRSERSARRSYRIWVTLYSLSGWVYYCQEVENLNGHLMWINLWSFIRKTPIIHREVLGLITSLVLLLYNRALPRQQWRIRRRSSVSWFSPLRHCVLRWQRW